MEKHGNVDFCFITLALLCLYVATAIFVQLCSFVY